MTDIIPTSLLCKVPCKLEHQEGCEKWLRRTMEDLLDVHVTSTTVGAPEGEALLVLHSVKSLAPADVVTASDLVKKYLEKWYPSRAVILQCRTSTITGRLSNTRVHIGPKGITVALKSMKNPGRGGYK